MDEIIKKLNENNNFHLSLKGIQITDNNLINEVKKHLESKGLTVKILGKNNLYNDLEEAYKNKIDYVLYDDSINILLPLFIVLTNGNTDIIKPIIPVYYIQKDNKVIQRIKTVCNSNYTMYNKIDEISEIYELLDKGEKL